MKRKQTEIEINASKEAVEEVLSDPAQFITNWPYVVRVSRKKGLSAEIMLPRFVFKFRDTYSFEYHKDYNSHIYDGTGNKSMLVLVVTLNKTRRKVKALLELSYKGRGGLFLGKTLQDMVEGIARTLKELAESVTSAAKVPEPTPSLRKELALKVDFSDPMSVATFLSKSRMAHSGLHVISPGELANLLGELRSKLNSSVLYVSGITQDGTSSFKVLLDGSQILAIEYRGNEGVEVIKVTDEASAKKALNVISKISGAYMVNVWVPVGGV
ncbi:hypothetical protein [Thermococcus stetteri]|uniref:hypothetical protein n=1 Tax=Thermococcus stetteri TaxID=49900 RepID=UPI001AE6482B|nr:hypothetical protein [Thermococcus stetteri]MBP1910921.1 hypothetical protein [Thermococcus stetteri]